VGERDKVKVMRSSPPDATLLTQPNDGAKLRGTRLAHFGAFLDLASRENDYLMGRLDGAERIVRMLVHDNDPVRIEWTRHAFLAILAEEEPVLGTAGELIARLRERAEALPRRGEAPKPSGGGEKKMNSQDRQARRQARDRSWSPRALFGRMSPEVRASWEVAECLVDRMKGAGEDHLSSEEVGVVKSRWIDQTIMYERQWRTQRWVYYLFRVPIILLATTIPVLASLAVPKEVTAFVGLAVALLTALDGFFQLGTRWQQHRHAAVEVGFEGWEFVELSGQYAKAARKPAYKAFVTNLESLNKRLASTYLDVFRAAGKDGKQR
jgi:hypothetical protein